jgi:hypothetical protein
MKKQRTWVNIRISSKAHAVLKARSKKEYKTLIGLINEWLKV